MTKKQFAVSVKNEDRKIIIQHKYTPVSVEDFIAMFKEIMLAWGFAPKSVDEYFALDDLLMEYEEIIKQKDNEIEGLKLTVGILESRPTKEELLGKKETNPEKVFYKLRCKLCGDVIQSKSVHDFVNCKCGNAFVDGGTDYFRYGAEQPDSYETFCDFSAGKSDTQKRVDASYDKHMKETNMKKKKK